MEKRKHPRLKEFDYSSNGAYFVTVCTQGKRHTLGSVVGAGHPAGPHTELTKFGEIVDNKIRSITDFYPHVFVDTYVVMPNHIHLPLRIDKPHGPAGCPAPTVSLPKIISALKSLSSREAGLALWQRGYYEHICRDYRDYLTRWQYIDDNPAKWAEDEYYN